ncbi:TerC/Alx family metal homeostasis membrane protein [Modicisalibacter tunisiensis]|uniref:TerC/Alx family metal homeostasis membrane protein n=1 Tax=Modicisalibacter tunisiensis TaxID=390637 RepID=A0ABS7X1S3_9GAMM|nr:TerC/Alx family metal homeostasis membrane protein [Modicisalibacter tunisiensis]MBZ9538650.1 TerC/Alx family metal homeostasis membrane protein [Modicisalibacter tunisiensis]MBZ9567937.1 TerC/Alx family metal homeostasis membrane protein [Modicisalibacter tunisiensis]
MSVPTWVWLATIAGIIALFFFDFLFHARKPHEPTLKEAAGWSLFFITIALLFGGGVWIVWGAQHGTEYFAGFITEKSLSVDNLFVFVILMSKFSVPRRYQQKVLLIGIAIALVMRGIFIALGAAAIAQFSWVFYLFGAFLLYTAAKLARESFQDESQGGAPQYHETWFERWAHKTLPSTREYHGNRLFARVEDKPVVTPLFFAVLALGFTDLLFALDSIPAIYGLTKAPYIVFTTNAFALLGLLQLYFLLGGLLDRLVYLGLGLSVILGFIGIKLILDALHENTLIFINDGQPLHGVPEVPIWLSLTIIVTTLVVTTVASLIRSRRGAGGSD